ncbi:MAG: hypothetical protein WCH07_11610 [Deltaproteobacteria bacterium]
MTFDLETRFDKELEAFTQDFGDHDYVKRGRLIRWLSQFGEDKIPLAIKLLKNIRYFGASNLMSMSQELVKMVINNFPHIKASGIFYTPIGGPGSGAQMIARHLKSNADVPNDNIVDLLTLYRESKKRKIDLIVFLEDFSGTGHTIEEWWNTNAPIILPIGSDVLFGILVLNCQARTILEKELTMMTIQSLEERDNVFSPECEDFDTIEKERLLSFCKRTGCSERYLKGYGECGLLVAFQHGCPNNSLPILWHENSGVWEALFRRRSV